MAHHNTNAGFAENQPVAALASQGFAKTCPKASAPIFGPAPIISQTQKSAICLQMLVQLEIKIAQRDRLLRQSRNNEAATCLDEIKALRDTIFKEGKPDV